jgi:hypothetical protein
MIGISRVPLASVIMPSNRVDQGPKALKIDRRNGMVCLL